MPANEAVNSNKEPIRNERYSLVNWLRYLGAWSGPSVLGKSEDEQKAALDQIDLSEKKILNGYAYDPDGYGLFSVSVETSYDKKSGVFDNQIIFWRHMPFENHNGTTEPGEHYTLSIRGIRDQLQDPKEPLPRILPDQIWVNGSLKFNGERNGGGDSPYDDKHIMLFDRITEFSARIKEHLDNRKPIQDIAKVMAGGAQNTDLLAEIVGSPFMQGLSPKGGFAKSATPMLLDQFQATEEDVIISTDNIETFKALNGFHINSWKPTETLPDEFDKTATHQSSGIRFTAQNIYEYDSETKRHIFKLTSTPENPPSHLHIPDPIEIVRMEYEELDDGRYKLVERNFIESDPSKLKPLSRQHGLIGYYQMCLADMVNNEYPKFRDHMYETRLHEVVSELHDPPSLEETGGETLWIPLNGRNLKKQVGTFGASLGGGNLFLQRGKKEDGSWSEVGVLFGLPFEPGGTDSDFEGSQPDILPYLDKIDTIILDHDHFDHATLEYYAKAGFLTGKKVMCSPRTQAIVEKRLTSAEVKRDQWPNFMNFDHPDVRPYGDPEDKTFAYPVKDEDGHIRGWVQICEGGSDHTALTDSHMFTGCYKGKFYQDTHFLYNDAFNLKKHGWRFASEGQDGLKDIPGVNWKNLRKNYTDPEQKYIVYHDPTNCVSSGHAPRPEDVKNVWREMLKLSGDDLVIHVPFSTNHLEYQIMGELCAEENTLRNTTKVGGNAQIRGTVMNKYGVNPDIDLREITIPPEFYPSGLEADIKDLIGNATPERKKSIKALKSERKEYLDAQGKDHRTDPTYHCLHYIDKAYQDDKQFDGNIGFHNDKPSTWNDYYMYLAFMAQQDTAALDATRTSDTAKEFRKALHKLLITTTGPIGSAEEQFATLYRYAFGESLLDYDEVTRNTGYQIPHDASKTIFVTQPPSMGHASQISQDWLMQKLIENRGDTVICSYKNGFKIYNPKDKLTNYMQQFKDMGWSATWDASSNQIRVDDKPFHVHGHGFYEDLKHIAGGVKAKLHEFIHIPSTEAWKTGQEIVEKIGGRTSSDEPRDHVGMRADTNPETGEVNYTLTDVLTPSYWLVRMRRKYGQNYGGVLEMVKHIVLNDRGDMKTSALDVRTDNEGHFKQHIATNKFNDWLTAVNELTSARASQLNPAIANVQAGGGKPRGAQTSMIFGQMLRGGTLPPLDLDGGT